MSEIDSARDLSTPSVATSLPYTTVFTDGSGNVGPGGWAWCVIDGPNAGAMDAGGDPDTTNQRMEISAAWEAVKSLPGLLLVVSDSQYVVRCFNDRWWMKWERKGWRTKKGPVANLDLWQPFIADVLARNGEVRFSWVKGHQGLEGNELADQLAGQARRAIMDLLPSERPFVLEAADGAL